MWLQMPLRPWRSKDCILIHLALTYRIYPSCYVAHDWSMFHPFPSFQSHFVRLAHFDQEKGEMSEVSVWSTRTELIPMNRHHNYSYPRCSPIIPLNYSMSSRRHHIARLRGMPRDHFVQPVMTGLRCGDSKMRGTRRRLFACPGIVAPQIDLLSHCMAGYLARTLTGHSQNVDV